MNEELEAPRRRGRPLAKAQEADVKTEVDPIVVEAKAETSVVDTVITMLEAVPGGENIARHVARLLK
jgi:hypothetical protein